MADVEVGSSKSASAAPLTKKESLPEEAFHNFLQGKRHILVQDYSHAVASLADACELYSKYYGETAIELGEVYFHYGKALFRLFQKQAGIFAESGMPESSNDDDDDDENEDDNEEGKDSASDDDKEKSEKSETEESNEAEASEGEDISKDEEASFKEEKEGKSAATVCDNTVTSSKAECPEKMVTENAVGESSKDKVVQSESTPSVVKENGKIDSSDISNPGPSTSTSIPNENAEDEISDLQLAWETLEMAKAVFTKQGGDNEEYQLKVAEILQMLGEISMECDNYPGAILDFMECLKISETFLKPDDRRIAETHYQMGLTYGFDNQFDLALESYQKSIDVLELRINTLKNQTEVEKTPEGFDIDPTVEINEIEGLLPEIKAKMDDVNDMARDSKKVSMELAFQKLDEVSSSSSKPATNINHLLKRKKPADQDNCDAIEVKRVKLNTKEANSEDKPEDQGSCDATGVKVKSISKAANSGDVSTSNGSTSGS